MNSESTGLHDCPKSVGTLGSWVRNPDHTYPWKCQNHQPRGKGMPPALWGKLSTTPESRGSLVASNQSHHGFLDSTRTTAKKGPPSFLLVLPAFFLMAPRPINWPSNYKQANSEMAKIMFSDLCSPQQPTGAILGRLWPETRRQVTRNC